MRHLIPHLWFDTEAKEAAEFYVSLFDDSRITHAGVLHGTPSGDCDIMSFELSGQPFMAISAGPYFKINPSISFLLNFDPSQMENAEGVLIATWEKLLPNAKVLMPLDTYPFSKRYGWLQDRFGVTWQLMLTDPAGDPRPFITPMLLFTNAAAGRAEEALEFCKEVFKGKRGTSAYFPAGMEPEKEGSLMFGDLNILNTWIAAMDSHNKHEFSFNEAVSLLIPCETQEEIDYYWEKLSAVPEAEQCGWLKDKFGVSWQVSPAALDEMMRGTPEQVGRVTQAFLHMKKFDLAALKRAYEG